MTSAIEAPSVREEIKSQSTEISDQDWQQETKHARNATTYVGVVSGYDSAVTFAKHASKQKLAQIHPSPRSEPSGKSQESMTLGELKEDLKRQAEARKYEELGVKLGINADVIARVLPKVRIAFENNAIGSTFADLARNPKTAKEAVPFLQISFSKLIENPMDYNLLAKTVAEVKNLLPQNLADVVDNYMKLHSCNTFSEKEPEDFKEKIEMTESSISNEVDLIKFRTAIVGSIYLNDLYWMGLPTPETAARVKEVGCRDL